MRKKLLVIEDNKRVLEILAFALGREGYQIIRASDGLSGLRLAAEWKPDLILIDLTQTEPCSSEVCRRLCEAGIKAPVIVFLSSEEQTDELSKLGVNIQHIRKPFQMRELLMQIKINTWENGNSELGSNPEKFLTFDRLEINLEQVSVTKDGLPIELTQREYDLLCYLAQEPGKVYSRETLLKEVWKYSYMGETRNVDILIRRLRKKIEDDPANPKTIITRRGHGYIFTGQV